MCMQWCVFVLCSCSVSVCVCLCVHACVCLGVVVTKTKTREKFPRGRFMAGSGTNRLILATINNKIMICVRVFDNTFES